MENNTALPNASQSCSAPTAHLSGSLVARYGAAALEHGYAAIPRDVLRYRHALQVSPGEWEFVCEVWSYWRSDEDPYPGVATIAGGLGVDDCTVRRYRASLEAKGLLRVYRDGRHNRYDLSPLIAAAVALAHRDQAAAATPRIPAHGHRAELHAKEELVETEIYDYDKTPTPGLSNNQEPSPPIDVGWLGTVPSGEEETRRGHLAGAAPGVDTVTAPAREGASSTPPVPPEDRVAARIAAIGEQLGDDTPASSVTRARNIQAEVGVNSPAFLEALEAAARRVGERAPAFRILNAEGQPNGMHYFFGVLRRQLRGASERPSRREPRARQADVAAAWANCPEPAPVGETHPVWRAALEELRAIMTTGNFETHLASTRAIGQDDSVLRVQVADVFQKQWLENRLARHVADALTMGGHPELRVAFVVEAAA